MARKPNYDYEKRRKELDRKKKRDERREERRTRRADNPGGADEYGVTVDGILVDPADLPAIASEDRPDEDADATGDPSAPKSAEPAPAHEGGQ